MTSSKTNDALLFLFITLTCIHALKFFENQERRSFRRVLLYICLAGLTKGNALVTLIALVLTCAVAAYAAPKGDELRKYWKRRAIHCFAAFALTGSIFGNYLVHFIQFGTPFVTNTSPQPWPDMLSTEAVTGTNNPTFDLDVMAM